MRTFKVKGYPASRERYFNIVIAQVAAYGVALITDDSKQGTILMIHVTGKTYEVVTSKSSLQQINLQAANGRLLIRIDSFAMYVKFLRL